MTLTEAGRYLLSHDRFLLLTHVRPDGDTLGSAAALALGLRQLGKTAYMLPSSGATAKFLPYISDTYAPEDYQPECIVAIDTASEGMLPEESVRFAGKIDFCIDHHPSNTGYAGNLLLNASAAACGEIILALLEAMDVRLTAEMADALYIAITTDTGCFAYANTSADTLRCAATLIAAGANNVDICKLFFRTKSMARIRLEGRILSGMEFFRDGAVAFSFITLDMLRDTGATEADMDDVAAIPSGIEGVRAGITLKELAPGRTKVSVRTVGCSANALCARFGGGGHELAAGCTIEADPQAAKALLISAMDEVFVF